MALMQKEDNDILNFHWESFNWLDNATNEHIIKHVNCRKKLIFWTEYNLEPRWVAFLFHIQDAQRKAYNFPQVFASADMSMNFAKELSIKLKVWKTAYRKALKH